jgi:hypothetical protein
MKNKKLLIRIMAIFLALCFFPNMATRAADYNLLVPAGALTALNNGDLIYEGDTISDIDATGLIVGYFDYDYSFLDSYSVSPASHTVLGAADVGAADPGGDQKFVGWLVSSIDISGPSSLNLTAYWEKAYNVTYNLNLRIAPLPIIYACICLTTLLLPTSSCCILLNIFWQSNKAV